MFAFQYDQNGYLLGPIECDPHPLRAHGWIVPGMATLAWPPAAPEGMVPRWTGTEWKLVPIPQPRDERKTPPSRYGRFRAWLAQLLVPKGAR